MSESDIRDELRLLGDRRREHQAREDQIASDVEDALRRAYGQVSVAEAARLLGLHRTTVYRVYHPHHVV